MKTGNWTGTVALAWAWLWAASWAEADEQIHQMLPLAVGNSWTYQHFVGGVEREKFPTISITHTEDIEGHTYHVFSDMPYEDPPVPHFFIAGNKVRWEGYHLLFRQQDRDVAIFQFRGHPVDELGRYSYDIPETESDTWVFVDPRQANLPGLARKGGCVQGVLRQFSFFLNGEWTRSAQFLENFGIVWVPGLSAFEATINGERWDFWNDPTGKVLNTREESPCITGTAVRKLSWGVLKQGFIHLSKPGELE